MKSKKLILSICAVVILLTAVCLNVFAATDSQSEEMNLKIYGKNLLLEDSIYISYAVPVEGTNGADVKMLFWLEPQSEYVYGTQKYELSPEPKTVTVENTECYVFNFRELAAKQMTVDVYARAYASTTDGESYSKLDKYSVLQYAYNMLGKTSSATPDAKTTKLLNSMLDYGAAAQEFFGVNTDRLANAEYYQIKVKGALLPDVSTSGLYATGTQLNVVTPEINEAGETFLYWQNSAGAQVSEETSYTITVSNANEIYTAVYGQVAEPVSDYLLYTELSDGTYSVKANPEADLPEAIAIPATYEDKAVTVIEENAFLNCASVTSISLPHGIKTIGDKAFSGCSGLSDFAIPASVISIGNKIFDSCGNLKTVYYNSSYGHSYVLSNVSIETVVFGGSKVPNYILYKGTDTRPQVRNIIIKDVVESVGHYAFYGCNKLENITMGKGISEIGVDAFKDCNNLTNVYINDLESWCRIAFYSHPMIYADNLYLNGKLLEEVIIPSSIEKINEDAFKNCNSITSVIIPDSVTSIGAAAFYNCGNLTNVVVPKSITNIGAHAFYYVNNLEVVYYGGTPEDWAKINIDSYNNIYNSYLYYYSASQPTDTGNYWRYVDGVPMAW